MPITCACVQQDAKETQADYNKSSQAARLQLRAISARMLYIIVP
jgi:hypothetical protein